MKDKSRGKKRNKDFKIW